MMAIMPKICYKLLIWTALLLSESAAEDTFKQQYFRVRPKDVDAQIGSEVTLPCEIEDRSGAVQWTKDGYALGYDMEIPGFPRYRMVGDRNNGVYNLHIRNVSWDDDAEYECQVGPLRKLHRKVTEIRSGANLTVLSAPQAMEITGDAEVQANLEMNLECHVSGSKPAANIVWYRGSEELSFDRDHRVDTTQQVGGNRRNPRTIIYDTYSSIRFVPTPSDDDAEYTCEARHKAVAHDMYSKKSVRLSVLYPPGDPFIEGRAAGSDTFRRGQTVELRCLSRGGNPLAQLAWYRNGEEVRTLSTVSMRKRDKVSEATLKFVANMTDNHAKLTCKASNVISPMPVKVEMNMTVLYAPLSVNIYGPKEARVSDVVELNCTTGASNPDAQILWTVNGVEFDNGTSFTEETPRGRETTSTLRFPITNRTSRNVVCKGMNKELDENVVASHIITVIYPPEQPVISGYQSGAYVDAGTVQHLMCKAAGGNPMASLAWYKNERKIHTVTKTDKNIAFSELHLLVNATDNEAVYRCEATNSAIEIPLMTTVQMKVYFTPEHVIIRREPANFRIGSEAKLICDASSSNPEANLTLWRDGIEMEKVVRQSKPGLHGGNATSISVTFVVTADMDGNLFTCQAQNPKLGRHIHQELTLEVMYKPSFAQLNETTFYGTEGENLVVPLQAHGHPQTFTYTWSKNGVPLSTSGLNYVMDKATLNFTKLSRNDGGEYSCEVYNSEGSATLNFTILVRYSASIKSISDVVMVNDNEDAELWCTVDANPLSAEYVTWRRPGFAFDSRTIMSSKNNTFYLVVRGVSRKDMGQFLCVADNGLGNETSQIAYLVVKHKPEIDQSPLLAKAAARKDDTARLACRASGAPKINFSWTHNGVAISLNTTSKYLANFDQLDAITYQSILSVHEVGKKDYGIYQCKASNALGSVVTNVNLTTPGRPDAPLEVRVVNATHDAITIAWSPGFDGGETAKFRVRYRDASAQTATAYKFADANRNTMHQIRGLKLGTSYAFSVLAYNQLGESEYVNGVQKASTSSDASPSLATLEEITSRVSEKTLLVTGVVVILIALFNAILCVLCYVRRRRKPLTKGANAQRNGKTANIEMYAPSSYNETLTGESSVSEKSETYSDTRQDYDEKKRNMVNPYMIEQVDYPYRYSGYDTCVHPKEPNHFIGQNRNSYVSPNNAGYHSENSSRYSSTSDPRYVTYPPPMPAPPAQYAQLSVMGNGTLRRGGHPPPDVTVLTTGHTQPLSTFNNYAASEGEGHLV